MCSAWATMRPRASKSAAEQSRRSLMFDEDALRTSTVPISSAIPERAALITDRVTGSTFAPGRGCPTASGSPAQPGRTRHVAPGQLDDRRARRRPSPGRAPARSSHSPSTIRAAAAPAALDRAWHCKDGRSTREGRDQPARDDLGLGVEPEPVAPLVRLGQARLPAVGVDGQLVRLAAVARVDEPPRARARQVRAPPEPPAPRTDGRRRDVVAPQVGGREARAR